MTTLLMAMLFLGAPAATAAPQQVESSRPDRVDELVRKHLGEPVTACARFKYQFIRGHKPTREEVALLKSCMAQAYGEGQSFYFSIEGSGIDSYVATGLMRAGLGNLQRFWYDSAPCGGPGCTERFQSVTCATPPKPDQIDPFVECLGK